jgi:hypothetical protein
MSNEYLDRLVLEAGVVEVAHFEGGNITSAWFDDAEAIRETFRTAWRKLLATGSLYTTINRIRSAEEIEAYRAENPNGRTKDVHIERYCRLMFDFDPVRPTGTSSTDDELRAAELRADGLARRLFEAHGWPVPARGMSGNGHHLMYRVALPNDAETREALRALHAGLAKELSDDEVDFDPTVRKPGQLCCLYGSVKRKGPNTDERPHRKSSIYVPSDWRQVPRKLVMAMAERYARKPSTVLCGQSRQGGGYGKGDYRTLDVVAWFRAHELYKRPASGNAHEVLCPWRHLHTTNVDGGSIVYEADGGWPGFVCQHSHCQGRTIRDVIRELGDADQFCREVIDAA